MNASSQSTSSWKSAAPARRISPGGGGGGITRVSRNARSEICRRWGWPVAAVQRSANRRIASTGPSAPGSASPAATRSSTRASTAAGTSHSDRTRLRGGVRMATATISSPSRTSARIGGPSEIEASRRSESRIPKSRLCSASRRPRNAPTRSRNAPASWCRSTLRAMCVENHIEGWRSSVSETLTNSGPHRYPFASDPLSGSRRTDMRRALGVLFIAVVLAACGDSGGGGGGGNEGATGIVGGPGTTQEQAVPPIAAIWFGTAYDSATMFIYDRALDVQARQPGRRGRDADHAARPERPADHDLDQRLDQGDAAALARRHRNDLRRRPHAPEVRARQLPGLVQEQGRKEPRLGERGHHPLKHRTATPNVRGSPSFVGIEAPEHDIVPRRWNELGGLARPRRASGRTARRPARRSGTGAPARPRRSGARTPRT